MNRNRIVGGLVLILSLAFPLIVTDVYFRHMAILIGIYMMGAISINLLLGYSGQLSLGHSAFVGVGAYASALAFLSLGIPFWGGIALAMITAGVLGYIVAKISLKLRGAYFVIMTIGVAQVLRLVSLNWVSLTRGPMGLTGIEAPRLSLGPLGTIDFSSKVAYYYLVLAFVLMALYVQYRVANSSVGRAVVSIRENEDLAECIGIDCYKHLVIVVVLSAIIAGASGSLYCHYVSFLDPGIFAFFLSVNFVMMAVGGGQGTFAGPIAGAILFTMIPEWLRVFGDARVAIYSVIVIVIVIFMPKGIVHYLSKMTNLARGSK